MNTKIFKNCFIACALLLSGLPAYATKGIVSDEAEPHFSTFQNRETFEDMHVKVLGGTVRMNRFWNGSNWAWNERWANITFNKGQQNNNASDAILAVYRAGQLYRKASETENTIVYESQMRQFITKNQDGYEWTDRNGNGIRYDKYGVMLSYYDRNKINVFLERDANGYITRIKDHFNNPVITYTWEPISNAAALTNTQGQSYIPQRLVKLTDYSGRSVSYTWNAENQLEKVTDVRGEAWTYTYANGLLTQLKDPENRITQYSIDKNGKFKSRIDADGRGVTYNYNYDKDNKLYYAAKTYTDGRVEESWLNEMGQVERQTSNGEDQSSVTYILSDNSVGVTNLVKSYSTKVIYWYRGDKLVGIERPAEPLNVQLLNTPIYIKYKKEKDTRGNLTITEYDQWKNIVKITRPDGSVETNAWHSQLALPLIKTDERGIITAYEYDTNGNVLTLTEAKGTPDQRITRNTYDEYGQLKTKTTGESAANNTALATTTYEYDQYGNVTKTIDPEGGVTNYSDFDALGNYHTFVDARASQLPNTSQYAWKYNYDAAGNKLSDLDPYSKGSSYTYTPSGDLKSITANNGSTTTLTSNASGLVLTYTDANGKITKQEYDKNNRPTIVTDANGNKRQSVYDQQGKIARTIDGENNAIQFTYAQNRLVATQYPTYKELLDYDNSGNVKQTTQQSNGRNYIRKNTYDVSGNLVTNTDAQENTNTKEYNAFKRAKKIVDANGGITQFTYDARDNLRQVKDPEGRLTIYTYNKNNQIISETKDGDQNTNRKRIYTYDANRNLITSINPDQEKTTYEYDQSNRLVKTAVHAHKDHTNPIKVVSYNLNAQNQLGGWSQQASNSLPQNVAPTADVIPLAEAYTYTNLGQLESVTADFGVFSKTYSYSYYPTGLKKTYTNPEGITYTYYYNKNNQLIAVHIPNNGQITYGNFNWLMPQTLLLPGGQKVTYKYNDFLRVQERYLKNASDQPLVQALYQYDLENNITKISANDGDYNFTYDKLYRLKTTDVPESNPANDETFDYDGVGNRTIHTIVSGQSTQTEGLTYNAKNQLTQTDANAVFIYTASGHTKTQTQNGVVTEYIYSHEERLIAVKRDNQLIAEYAYNPQGQRIKKTVNGNATYYLYNENGLTAEYNSSGSLIKEYQFHPQKSWMTNPLFMRTATNDVYYYYNDHLGTPHQLIDSAGQVMWQAKYNAFGKAYVSVNVVENNLRFSGQYFDAETSLSYNYFRSYDQSIGRYIESDPVGLQGGINTYAYVKENPNKYVDPSGQNPAAGALEGAEIGSAIWPGPGTLIGGALGFGLGWYGMQELKQALDENTDQNDDSDSGSEPCPPNKPCPPCNPPVGTVRYEVHMVPPHKPHYPHEGSHIHYFTMNQSPSPQCRCFWKRNSRPTSELPPPDDMDPM